MKKLQKIILILLVTFVLIFLSAYIFFNVKGKDIIASQLQNRLRPKVKIKSVRLILPLTVKMHQLSIENFLEAEDLLIEPSLLSFLSGNIGFSKIALVNPKITIQKFPDGRLNVVSLLKPTTGESKQIFIGNVSVKNGIINFVDKTVSPSGFIVQITDLNMNISNPFSPRFRIDAKVQGRDKASTGLFKTYGWISFLRKDMKADLVLANLDGAYFSPYFQKFLSNQKLKNAVVNSQVNLTAKNNEIEGKCHLEINDIIYKEQEEQVSESNEAILPNPLSFVLGSGGDESKPKQITLDLPIKGTLIPFKINLVKITGSIFTEMLKETLTQEPEKLPEKIEAIGEKFKGFGKELEKIFKEKYQKQEE